MASHTKSLNPGVPAKEAMGEIQQEELLYYYKGHIRVIFRHSYGHCSHFVGMVSEVEG